MNKYFDYLYQTQTKNQHNDYRDKFGFLMSINATASVAVHVYFNTNDS